MTQEVPKVNSRFCFKKDDQFEDFVDQVIHEETITKFTIQINYYRDRERDLKEKLSLKYEEIAYIKPKYETIKLKLSSSSVIEELNMASNKSEIIDAFKSLKKKMR